MRVSIFRVFVVEEKKKQKSNDNWMFWFGECLVQKWPFRDGNLFSKKWFVAETPIFIVFLGARLLGQVVKKAHFGQPPPNKNLANN